MDKKKNIKNLHVIFLLERWCIKLSSIISVRILRTLYVILIHQWLMC